MGVELSQVVHDEDLPPTVPRVPLPVNHKHFRVHLVVLVDQDADDSEKPHQPRDHIESDVELRILRNQYVYVGGSFGEDEPVAREKEQEVEHPQTPATDEIQEEEERSLSIQIADVGFNNGVRYGNG